MDQESLASPTTKEKLQKSMTEPTRIGNPQTNPSSERIIPISLSPKPFTKLHNPTFNQETAPESRLETTNNNDYYQKVSDIISNKSNNNINHNNNETSQRRSLLVTLEDGSTTETQGSIGDIKHDCNNPSIDIIDIGIDIVNNHRNDHSTPSFKQPQEQYSNLLNSSDALPYADADLHSIDNFVTDDDNRITIEEIEQTTLERETTNREFRTDFKENDPNVTNTEVREESKVNPGWNKNIHHKIRLVPIKLDDGKVIQKNQEETIETTSEFTNYSHQEFIENPMTKEIPRFDTKHQNKNMPSESSKTFVKERVIPITLENTGQTIIPSFTKLEDPQPPEWSIFSQKNVSNENTKENIIPIRMVDMADEESVSVAGSEYENAPRQRHDSNSRPKWVPECSEKDVSPSHNVEKTGTRPKTKLSSQMSQDNNFSAKPPIGSNKGAHSYNDSNAGASRDDRSFSKASPEKPKLPPKPKSPSIKKKEENTTSDTKKILSKTTETTKTTTEKRSQTVRFNLDDDDGNEEKESKTDSNGKRPKFDNNRMRHKPPPYGASYRSNSADGGTSTRDGQPKMGSRGYPHNVTRDDASSRSRVRSRSGPYYRAYPTADGTKVEYSHDDEKALQEIDKDITRIWRELQELDGMSPARNEQSSIPVQQKEQNQDRGPFSSRNPNALNGHASKDHKPKYETVTVREFTMPSPVSASPTRIRSVSSSSNQQSSLSKDGTKEKKPDSNIGDSRQRTIWDMDCSEPLDPNHVPNYSTPSRRSRDTQRSGLIKPTWRRSLSGSRNPYEELSTKNDTNKMSTSLVSDSPIQSQAFATPFGTKITPTPIRRSQQSNRQTPSPQRPLSSSYIPSSSTTTEQRVKLNGDTKCSTAALPIEKSVQPLNQSGNKHDSIAYADEDFQDCMDDFPHSSSLNRNNVRTGATNPVKGEARKTKDVINGPSTTANSVAIQTGQSSDAATQTGNDTDIKSGKSSKSSCIIA